MIWIVSSMILVTMCPDVRSDPYNAVVRRVVGEGEWSYGIGKKVIQGAKTESVPSWRAEETFPKSVARYSMRLLCSSRWVIASRSKTPTETVSFSRSVAMPRLTQCRDARCLCGIR